MSRSGTGRRRCWCGFVVTSALAASGCGVIIDLTPVRAGTGPSKAVFKAWLDQQPAGFRGGIEVVAMDGFTGFKTAAAEALLGAVEVMDPFHVVRLAGDALDQCRRCIQQATLGHRGRTGDPLCGIRRALHTSSSFLTNRQQGRIDAVFTGDDHIAVEVTWGIYQRTVAAYRDPDRGCGKRKLQAVIDALRRGLPAALIELRRLGRTLARRATRRGA